MPIETNNLVLYKSERLTDTDDGGGKYSGQVIVDGQSNNLFNDVSEMDRTMGRVSMRKIFPAVTTDDTDALMGATVFISENPKDPNVSALLFSTESWTDERLAAQNRVENYLAKGGQAVGIPLDTLWQGMKVIQVAMFKQEIEANVGDTIVLVSNEGLSNQQEQYVRITKVETRTAILIVNNQSFEYKVATYDINDPLERDFVGLSASQWYNGNKSTTIIRDTLVADTGKYYASVDVTEDANVGQYTIQAASIFSQLVPSAQIETPLVDLNASSESVALVSGNAGTITAAYAVTVGTSQNLYIGSSVMPSSLVFTLFGNAITDQGGLLKKSDGTQVGTIDYQRGLIQWTASAGTGSANLSITFKPAAAPTQPFHSYAVPVTQTNQSTNWTGVLVPIPAPGSLTVSYMSQGKFYTLKDNGYGQLKGSSDAYGAGTINYSTGSWLLTAGALPDVDTPILLLWGSPMTTFERANLAVLPAAIEFELDEQGIAASSVTVSWLLDGVSKTAISNAQGHFTGDATGTINYAAGTGRIVPNKLPQKATVFTINYSYGTALAQVVSDVPPSNGQLSFSIGTGAAIQPNSVELSIPVVNRDPISGLNQYRNLSGTVVLTDIPVNASTGNLVDRFGNIQGTITYATGAVQITPVLNQTVYNTFYLSVNYVAG
ncbi:hypothetical protein [Acinetobacter zhairhuonensis]|uniref:hypothetical protein n=1 Tax=Acinetobacter sp. A7.4 TaxID=2919921 RepID=UPI001F4F9EFE|nr:hypothetical protein [Acinetobacter sp. A7.4]MCJ8161859.1 hypothetical protein [Acinetobacter sp. A7.4]